MLKFSNYIKENNHNTEEFSMVNGKLEKMSHDILELQSLIKEGNIDPWIFDKISVCSSDLQSILEFYNSKELVQEKLKNIVGKKIKLISTDDKFTKLKEGDEGVVTGTDSMGNIQVKWNNGSILSLIPKVDKYKIFS